MSSEIPEYQRRWPGLYVREGERIVEASPQDIAVARSYPEFADKGPVVDGRRITILTESLTHRVGDDVRVIHVVDLTEPGQDAYVMGPKVVFGEYVNETLMTPPMPDEDPLHPATYNGVILPSPAVDYNYDITSYRFETPGLYRIQWRLDGLRSNVLPVRVEP
jgi:hypothetical protein